MTAPAPAPPQLAPRRTVADIAMELGLARADMDSLYGIKGRAARDLKAARIEFAAARDALHALERRHAALESELLEAQTAAARALLHPSAT